MSRPPTKLYSPKAGKWHARLVRSGYFLGAVLLHLILLFMLATLVIFRLPAPQNDDTIFSKTTRVPPPPVQTPPPPAGGNSASQVDPTLVSMPQPTAQSIVNTVSLLKTFTVNSQDVKVPNLPESVPSPDSGSAPDGNNADGSDSGPGMEFGRLPGTGQPMLEGFLYDLKQTRDRQPTGMDSGKYHNVIKQFITGDWDVGMLASYYKSEKALSTPQIFIPIIKAEDGPKAFGVEGDVAPKMYCIWYKVTASAPQDGTYRFVGAGDDILVARVNHRTVLDGCSSGAVDDEVRRQETKIAMTNFNPTFPPNGDFWVGLPFHANAGEPMDIEVLIGEQPGGHSDYFLYIQRDDESYKLQSNGSPILPIFQVNEKPFKTSAPPMTYPPYSDTPEPWTVAPKEQM